MALARAGLQSHILLDMFGGIAVAGNLLCLAHAEARGKVFLVDLDERRLMSLWEYGPIDGGYADAGGVAMAADFAIFVADTRNDVVRCFSPFGKEIAQMGTPAGRAPGARSRDRLGVLDRPRGVAVHDGVVWVACGEGGLVRGVQQWSRDGVPIGYLHAGGAVDGRFGAPRGVWAGSGGVLVADTLNGVVQRFTPDGRFVGALPTAAAGNTRSRPVAVVPGGGDELLVADQGDRPGLYRFGLDGDARGEVGPAVVDLVEPTGLARDRRGRVYVLDRDGERVQRLTPDLDYDGVVIDVAEVLHDA